MTRSLLIVVAAAAVLLGCSTGRGLPPTTTAPPGASTPITVDRSTPERAAQTLYLHLRAGDCRGVRDDLSAAELTNAVTKAGGEDQLCTRLQGPVRDFISRTNLEGVTKKSEESGRAVVTLRVRDASGRVDTSDLSLQFEGEAWKVSRFLF